MNTDVFADINPLSLLGELRSIQHRMGVRVAGSLSVAASFALSVPESGALGSAGLITSGLYAAASAFEWDAAADRVEVFKKIIVESIEFAEDRIDT